jgi:RHS repeat-associated protein
MKTNLLVALFLLCISFNLGSAPRVIMPNGELRDKNTDLRVKVLGGAISIERTWMNGRWYLNPAWANLKFKRDRIDNTIVTYIDRAGSVYELLGDGVVYQFDAQQYIRREPTSWVWFDRMGNTMTYDDNGVMQGYKNKNGVKVRLEHNTAGQLIRVFDHFDTAILNVTYNGTVLNSISDYTGRLVRYIYDGTLLKEFRDVDDKSYFYTYNSDNQLLTIKDPENRITKVTYASSFPVTGIAVPPGIGFSGRAGRDFRVSKVGLLENSENEKTIYDYDFSRGGQLFSVVITTPEKRKLEYRYDVSGRLVTQVDGTVGEFDRRTDGPYLEYVKNERGLITRYEYDSYRNITHIEYPNNTMESWKYLPTFSYVTEHTDAKGIVNRYQYNNTGQVIERHMAVGMPEEQMDTYNFDSYGRLIKSTKRVSLSAPDFEKDAVTTYEYDNYGNRTQITDAEGNVWKYSDFDAMGNARQTTDPRNHVRTMEYSKQGWLRKSTNTLGYVSEMRYDLVGQLIESVTPIDGTRKAITRYEYDRAGRLTKTIDPLLGEITQHYTEEGRMNLSKDQRQVESIVEYDSRSREIKRTDGNHNELETIYGDSSNALEGLVAERRFPTYRETYKYDNRDRQTEVTQILSPTISYTFKTYYDSNSNVIGRTDAKGRNSVREYDALDRLIKETDSLNGRTIYTYDERDNLLSMTDAKGNKYTYTYDRINRKLTEKRPMGQTIHYRYDRNGNLVERISPNGAKRQFTYDDENRLIKEEHIPTETKLVSKTMVYTYDQRGLLRTYDDGLTSGIYIYNNKGERISESITFGRGPNAFTKTIMRTYEANGLLKSLTYPGNIGTANYSYDTNNQLKTHQIPGLVTGNDTLAYQYSWNKVREIIMPGRLRRTVTLDALLRPEKIEVKGYGPNSGNNGQSVMDNRYIYDEKSNILKKTTLDGDYVYEYDQLDRLLIARPPLSLELSAANPEGLPVEAYSYDAVHNRNTSAHQPGAWIYNDNNELTQWGQGSKKRVQTFNLNGSMIEQKVGEPAKEALEYTYDEQDRLRRITKNGVTSVEYAYDPMGHRIWRQAGSDVTWFLYSDEGLIQEISNGANEIRTYGRNPRGMWGTDTVWQKDTNGTYISNNDHLYTTEALTAASDGVIKWQGIRESFGNTTIKSGAATQYLLRLPGQWEDNVGGFNQNWMREFQPSNGRFNSIDPSFTLNNENNFAYSKNGPNNKFDYDGFSARDVNYIVLIWIQTIDYMTKAGLRHPDRSYNNRCSRAPWFPGCPPGGNKYKDCGDQVTYVNTALEKYQSMGAFDDEWNFYPDAAFGHSWGIALSCNETDPAIWHDPRAGLISVGVRCTTCYGWFGYFSEGERDENYPRYCRANSK